MSSRAMAQALTERGHEPPRGGAWSYQTVLRMMERLGLKGSVRSNDTVIGFPLYPLISLAAALAARTNQRPCLRTPSLPSAAQCLL